MARQIKSFQEFWPFYLSQHQNRVCRALHYLGTTLGISILIYALSFSALGWIFWGLVFSYAAAWSGHLFFERNRPATFQYPLWSFMADFKMYFYFLSGQLAGELKRAESTGL